MPARRPTATDRRTRRRRAAYDQWLADHPDATPYDRWPETSDALQRIVTTAIADRPAPAVPMTYMDQHRKVRPLAVIRLAVGLHAIECVGEQGISYGQLSACAKACLGVGCHRSEACAIFRSLIDLGLTAHVAHYSVGRHGNIYRAIHDADDQHRRRHDPTLRTPPASAARHAAAAAAAADAADVPHAAADDDEPFP